MNPNLRILFWSIVIIVMPVLGVRGQSKAIDSLQNALGNIESPIERAHLLYELSINYLDYDFEESFRYANEALDAAKDANDPETLTKSLTAIGTYYYFKGDYSNGIFYFKRAIQASEDKNFGEYPALTHISLGDTYRVKGRYDSAMLYYWQARSLCDERKATPVLASLYASVSFVHVEMSAFDSARWYAHKFLLTSTRIGNKLQIGEAYRILGRIYLSKSNYDSASFYQHKLLNIATLLTSSELNTFYNLQEGDILKAQGKFAEAIKFYEAALEVLNRFGYKRYQAMVLQSIGDIYTELGNYTKALEHLLSALKLNEQLQSDHQMGRTYSAIGWMYVYQKNYDLAHEYGLMSLSKMKAVRDAVGIAYAHNLLGMVARHQKLYTNALLYFDSAYIVREKYKLDIYAASTLQNKGYVYEENGDIQNALRLHLEALNVFEKLQSLDRVVVTSNYIGSLYSKQRSYSKAEGFFHRALRATQATGRGPGLQQTYLNLAHLYRATGNYEKSSIFFERHLKLSDSLSVIQNSQKIAEMNALYKLEEKEQTIKILNAENQLSQDKIQLQRLELTRKNNLIVFGVVGIIFLASISLLLWRNYRDKSNANKRLKSLNSEIQEKNEEIMSQSEELTEANQTINSINITLEQKVEERTSQLKQAYVELDTFFYRSSHDFRRPLTTFMGLAEVAKITVKDTNALDLFEKVKDTAVNLDQMLHKLQSVSDMGAQQLVKKEVHLENLVLDIIENQHTAIERKGIHIKTNFESTRFDSYPALVRIIIENLVENSIQFCSAKNPWISISSTVHGQSIQLMVEDNGVGIEPEHHVRIFDMYYRANLNSKGNGLGLYIVKKALEKIGGTIQFKSEPGKGSTFYFNLSIA